MKLTGNEVRLADGTRLVEVIVEEEQRVPTFIPGHDTIRYKLLPVRRRIKSGKRKGRYRIVKERVKVITHHPAKPIMVTVSEERAWVIAEPKPRRKRPEESWMPVDDYQRALLREADQSGADISEVESDIFRLSPDVDYIEVNTRFVWHRKHIPYDLRLAPPIGKAAFRLVRIWFMVAMHEEGVVTYSIWCRTAQLQPMTDWWGLCKMALELYAQVVEDLLHYEGKKTYKHHAVAEEFGLLAWTGYVGGEKAPHKTEES